jgi:Tfp pilus assembly protein PilN
MSAWWVALALVLAGCSPNVAELEAIKAGLEVQLAEKKEIAQLLNDRRRELDALDQRLAEVLDAGVFFGEVPRVEAPRAPVPVSSAMLPPVSVMEGRRCANLRREIEDLQLRIRELEKAIGEVNRIDRRKEEIRQRLKVLAELRRDGGR